MSVECSSGLLPGNTRRQHPVNIVGWVRPASAAAAGTERCPPPPLERAPRLSSGDFRRVSTRGLWVGIITKIVQGQFGSYSSRRTNLANSMTTRECEPIPISLAPSVALTVKSICRPSTFATSASPLTRRPAGVAAR